MIDPITILGLIFKYMSGKFGASIIAIILVIAFFRMAAQHQLHYFVYALLGGVGVFGVSWAMSQWFIAVG